MVTGKDDGKRQGGLSGLIKGIFGQAKKPSQLPTDPDFVDGNPVGLISF